jgi:hypothetical protein
MKRSKEELRPILEKGENELKKLISKQPTWVRQAVTPPPPPIDPRVGEIWGLGGNTTASDSRGFRFPSTQMRAFMQQAAKIIGPIPRETRHELTALVDKWVLDAIPGEPGRPSEHDEVTERMLRLKETGQTWRQIGQRYGLTADAARMRVNSYLCRTKKTPA